MAVTLTEPATADPTAVRGVKAAFGDLAETHPGGGVSHLVLADRNPGRGARLAKEFTRRGVSVSVVKDPFALPALLGQGLPFRPTLVLMHVDEFVTIAVEQAVTLTHVTDVALGALGSRADWDVQLGVVTGKPLTHAEVLRAMRAGATHAWSWAGDDLDSKFRHIVRVATPELKERTGRGSSASVRTPLGDVVLTGRERQLLFGASRGLSKQDMATRLRISEGTVKSLMQRLYGRLEVQGVTEAVSVAYREGILH